MQTKICENNTIFNTHEETKVEKAVSTFKTFIIN